MRRTVKRTRQAVNRVWRSSLGAVRLPGAMRPRCPNCRRPTARVGNPYRPFCSERCKLLDLAAWADERYRVPGEPVSSEPEAPDDGPPRERC